MVTTLTHNTVTMNYEDISFYKNNMDIAELFIGDSIIIGGEKWKIFNVNRSKYIIEFDRDDDGYMFKKVDHFLKIWGSKEVILKKKLDYLIYEKFNTK